jgi:hypothetical protein
MAVFEIGNLKLKRLTTKIQKMERLRTVCDSSFLFPFFSLSNCPNQLQLKLQLQLQLKLQTLLLPLTL